MAYNTTCEKNRVSEPGSEPKQLEKLGHPPTSLTTYGTYNLYGGDKKYILACQYCHQSNKSHVIDPYELLDECRKVQIDFEIEKLERQTRINESNYACDQRPISGIVVVAKNESAELVANYTYIALYRSNMYNRLCQKFFVFVYSADDQKFDWAIGRHSLITKNEMEAIYRKQIKNLDHVAFAISNMISSLRITVVEKISKGLSDQHCHYQTNESLIVDPYGLLSDCEKIQIANQLTELQLQTRTNQSSNACVRGGLRGVIIVLKNENALHAAEAFYRQMNRNFSSLDYRFNCKNTFVLAYSYETTQFGFQVGDDSFLNRYDAKIILEKQAKIADASRWVDFISGLITSIQTGALKKLDTINDSELYGLAALLFKIALLVGILGNVLCIVAISFTKLIQNNFHKYLLVLLTSDTLFILWCFGKIFTEVENRHFLTCALLSTLAGSTMCAGSNILVLLTMERFFAIVFPFWHIQYGHINRWIIILVAILPMQLYSIYFHLVRPYFDPESFTIFENGRCYHEGLFRFKLITIPFQIFMFVIPLMVVIFVNVTITIKLRQQRNSKTSSNKSSDASNDTLWILPIIYTALSTPRFILTFIKTFFYPTSPTFLMDSIEGVTDFMFLLDFVYHWFFYAISSSSFRKTFISFWFRICSKIRGAPEINSSTTWDYSIPKKHERIRIKSI